MSSDEGYPIHQFLPEALNKALYDEFDYMLGLKSGEMFRFISATYNPDRSEWIHLTIHDENPAFCKVDHCFERGVDVRISEIEWCADAPKGS